MKNAYFEMQWPRSGLYVNCFVHEIMNYRYHWHPQEYELSILLHGSQEFCRGMSTSRLEEDDVILVDPGKGHASFGQQANTRALVVHFSASALKPYVKKGYSLDLSSCCSDPDTRREECYSRIRFYAAQLYRAAAENGPYASLTANGCCQMLLSTLCTGFETVLSPAAPELDEPQQRLARQLMDYIERNYREKLTLEDLARYAQYNRTYVSTLFRNVVGVNFHEYLTRVRFQNALLEVAATGKNLTDIALENGFSDLKSLNARFKETLHLSPAEYRAQVDPERVAAGVTRKFTPPEDEIVRCKLDEYTAL